MTLYALYACPDKGRGFEKTTVFNPHYLLKTNWNRAM